MTDEERQKFCVWLRTLSHPAVLQAADEIERLAAHVNALEHIINLDMYEATKTALVQAQDEIERLAAELELVESENEHHLRLAFIDAGANPARSWKEAAERLERENRNLWVIIRNCQNDVLVAERERDEVLCRLKGTMQ